MMNRCSSPWRVLRGLVFAALALLLTQTLQAQPEPSSGSGDDGSTSAPADEAKKLEQAKRFFREGNELRKVRDYERALERYVRSRALVPSGPNTMNAAFCLDKLGRADEALEMYEELLTRFPDTITDADRDIVIPTVARLRKEVGSLEVDANVDGQLVIDGRDRGMLPRTTPVRVMPGKRKVRVLEDGYHAFEQTVEVAAGETVRVDAKLDPLVASGRVQIAQATVECKDAPRDYCVGADVWVDGAMVGQVPWEGELAPGNHWLVLRKGVMGSAPQNLVVVKGQVVTPEVVVAPLGPAIEIVVEPRTAELRIDDVAVGMGGWRGSLPLGDYELHAHEAGYHDDDRRLVVEQKALGKIFIELEVDEDHERWGVTDISAAGVLTFVGYGLGAAGIVVGSILGTMTLSDQEKLATDCQVECEQGEIDDLRNQAHGSTASFIAAGAGVALGTVAMIVWLTESDGPAEEAQVTLRPYGLGGLALEGRF